MWSWVDILVGLECFVSIGETEARSSAISIQIFSSERRGHAKIVCGHLDVQAELSHSDAESAIIGIRAPDQGSTIGANSMLGTLPY